MKEMKGVPWKTSPSMEGDEIKTKVRMPREEGPPPTVEEGVEKEIGPGE